MVDKHTRASKLYRKLLSAKSEYQAYLILERLDGETAKMILQRLVNQRIQESN